MNIGIKVLDSEEARTRRAKGQGLKEEKAARAAWRFPLALSPRPLSLVLIFPGIFGPIRNPLGSTAFPDAGVYGTITAGLPAFISNVVKLVTIAAGVWMFGNLLTAGFMYLTSGGETEKITKAWGMIYQSLIGLLIIVSSFAITGVVSQLLFGNPNTILEMKIFGPGSP